MRLEFESNVSALPLVDNQVFEGIGLSATPELELLLKKGIKAAQDGDREQARKLLSHATAVDPACEDAWMWLASISEYPEELLAFLNRVLEINPENERAAEWRTATRSLLAKTFVQRAIAANDEGSATRAEQCLDQALALDNNYETAWFWKAALAPDDDEKLAFLDRILRINHENQDALNAVAAIKRARSQSAFDDANEAAAAGDSKRAVDILDGLLQDASDPILEKVWHLKATLAESYDQKLEFLDRVLEINPENEAAVAAVAEIRASRSQAAFAQAKEAAVAGNRKKAIKILDEFLKDVPDSVDAWLLKSHLSLSPAEKTESLEKALEIDPQNAAAKSGLEFLSLTFGSTTPKTVETVENHESVESEYSEPESKDAAFASQPTDETINFDDALVTYEIEAIQEEFAGTTALEPEMTSEHFEGTDNHEAVEAASGFGQYEPAEYDPPAAETVNFDHSEELSGPVVESVDADSDSDTVETLSPFEEKASVDDDDYLVEVGPDENNGFQTDDRPQQSNTSFACPFCHSANDPLAFACTSCHGSLTLSDIESLLSNADADQEEIQHAVTQMEAEWNLREFSVQELTFLGIGHFNLHRFESGFKYLQEASRLDPNNVILAGHVNTLSIRLAEMNRQAENNYAMPKGKTILVVDDSPTVRKLIAGKLEKAGHSVVCAVDGIDGLAKIEERLPDLVLLDITMPRMDGYEVCKQIRANGAAKDVPVVMISGKDGFFDKVRGRMAGTTGYITKPFGPETLMKAIETYLVNDNGLGE